MGGVIDINMMAYSLIYGANGGTKIRTTARKAKRSCIVTVVIITLIAAKPHLGHAIWNLTVRVWGYFIHGICNQHPAIDTSSCPHGNGFFTIRTFPHLNLIHKCRFKNGNLFFNITLQLKSQYLGFNRFDNTGDKSPARLLCRWPNTALPRAPIVPVAQYGAFGFHEELPKFVHLNKKKFALFCAWIFRSSMFEFWLST